MSPKDQTRDKIPFYEGLGVRELLVIDRDPLRLELYQLEDGQLTLTGESSVADSKMLSSRTLPFQFRMVKGTLRPGIEVICLSNQKKWLV